MAYRWSSVSCIPSSGGIRNDSMRNASRSLRYEPLEDRRLLAIITVDTAEDAVDLTDGRTSLREAIFAANTVPGPDEIRFDLGADPATIRLTEGEIPISDALTITGSGTGSLIIDASGNDPTPGENNGDGSRIFWIIGPRRSSVDVSISGVTLTGGDVPGAGGAINSFGNLKLSDVVVTDNHANFNGGGLLLSRSADLHGVAIENNSSARDGGGVFVNGGAEVSIESSAIVRNTAIRGGGGLWSAFGATTAIVDSVVSWNQSLQGGGLGLQGSRTSVFNSRIITNSASEGGGIYTDGGTLSVHSSRIASNHGAGLRSVEAEVLVSESEIASNRRLLVASRGHGVGVAQSGGTLTIRESVLEDNSELSLDIFTNGGAVWVEDGTLRITDSEIRSNNVTGSGGGVFAERAVVDVLATTFENHSGPDAIGAIAAVNSVLNVDQSAFQSNVSGSNGGALYLEATKTVITRSRFERNIAGEGDGGAIYVASSFELSPIVISDTTFDFNMAAVHGGAIANATGGVLDIRASRFGANTSGVDGGAVYSPSGADLAISETTFVNNSSEINGGAIYTAGTFSMRSSLLFANRAGVFGGGLYGSTGRRRGTSSLLIDSSSIVRNSANVSGGGAYLTGPDIEVVNSTISNNEATQNGGGVFLVNGGREVARIRHSTVAFNRDFLQGPSGGIVVSEGGLFVGHSIVFGNRSDGESYDLTTEGSGSSIDVSYALVGTVFPGSRLFATNLMLGVDPQLSLLRPVGPPLPLGGRFGLMMHTLGAGSPALNAGDPTLQPGVDGTPEFDQRGAPFSRDVPTIGRTIVTGIDLGAYEEQSDTGVFNGDFDGSRLVSGNDFLIWQRNQGVVEGATKAIGDATGDGDVDLNDLAVWEATYGRTVPGPPRRIVAEPADTSSAESIDFVFMEAAYLASRRYRPSTRVDFQTAQPERSAESLIFEVADRVFDQL